MNNLKEGLKKIWEKFKGFNNKIKIAVVVSIIAVIVVIISVISYATSTNYSILFSGLDSDSSETILASLEEDGIDYKVSGDSILVPDEQVDELRLTYASEIDSNEGYELLDDTSSFGLTDDEYEVLKLRALQGELASTIESFSQVADASVYITPAQDSVFVDNAEEGSASVYIELESGETLTADQVKSIMALVSGSCENIPTSNIEVIDSDMNLLSDLVNDDDSDSSSSSSTTDASTNLAQEQEYEDELEEQLTSTLETILGSGNVEVIVNADLNFDSVQTTETVYDPNKVIVSQSTSTTTTDDGTSDDDSTDGSAVDENTTTYTDEDESDTDDSSTTTTTSEDVTTNYDVGQTDTVTISAPGSVNKLTASIIVNNAELSDDMITSLENSVAAAIGLDTSRGDYVSVVGMDFAETDDAVSVDDMYNSQGTSYTRYYIIGGVVAAILLIGGIVFFIIRRRRKDEDEDEGDNLLDVVIDDKISKTPEVPLKPIQFEETNEQTHMESELKRYASEKPEQVVDIVKSWLTENER